MLSDYRSSVGRARYGDRRQLDQNYDWLGIWISAQGAYLTKALIWLQRLFILKSRKCPVCVILLNYSMTSFEGVIL